MWGLIVGVALGGLLLMTVATTLRDGELALGEVVLRRGEPRYWLAVGLLGVAGLAAAGSALALGADLEGAPDRRVEHGGYSFVIPGTWGPLEDTETALPSVAASSDLGIVGYGGPSGEVVVMWRRTPLDDGPGSSGDDPREELITGLRQPGLDYRRWEPSDRGQARIVDMEYPSPRGSVRARAIARILDEPAELEWILASCAHDGRPADCERVASSLQVAAP